MKKYIVPACELAGIILIVLFIITSPTCNKHEFDDDTPVTESIATDSVIAGESRSIPEYHLTVQPVAGKKRIFWSDGVQTILSHADSPEGGLNPAWRTSDEQYSRAIAHRGINARTYTLRGDDVTSVHPYTNTWQKIPDRAKMEVWKQQFLVFINECKAQGIRPVLILYIGERTNWNKPLSEYQAWLSMFAEVMKSGEDITGHITIGIEEIGQRSGTTTLYSDNEIAAWWNPLNAYIKSIMPYCITMLHNNPGDKFWRATSPPLQVDVINVQETTITNMEATANDALNRGYAIHLHEWYGAIKASQSNATNISKLNQQLAVAERTGCKCSGIFANDIDTQRPDTNKLKAVHIHQGNYFYGNIQPPDDTVIIPTTYTLKYSLSSNRSNPQPLPTSFTVGNKYIWVEGVTEANQSGWNISLYKSGVMQSGYPRSENSLPIDIKGGSITTATAQYFSAGSWRLLIKRNGVPVFDVSITVQ